MIQRNFSPGRLGEVNRYILILFGDLFRHNLAMVFLQSCMARQVEVQMQYQLLMGSKNISSFYLIQHVYQ
ncbi:hypothetical protein DAI22_07g131900 [Oryza sativa Japonica Group]|nr:hypothetical protein DAI22_07g131900 [Oryza sativa Japonica Group]